MIVRIACALVGLFIIGLAFREWQLNRRSATWPSVPGRITRSVVSIDYDNRPYLDFEYSYTVPGSEYTSSNIAYGGYFGEDTYALAKKYPSGAQVLVYFDPAEPSRSTLETGPSNAWIAAVGVGAVFLAYSAADSP